jgi:PAS domain S-box-containing protein
MSCIAALVARAARGDVPRVPVLLLALGTALFLTGDTLYSFRDIVLHNSSFPSFVDVIYLCLYPPIIAGLAILVRRRGGRGDWVGLLDAAIVTLALGLVSWLVLMAPYVHDASLSSAEQFFSLAYPMGDIAVLALLVRLAVLRGARSTSLWLLTAGVVGMLVADSLFGYESLTGSWKSQGPIDIGWIAFYLAWGAAALHPATSTLFEATVPRTHPSARRLVIVASAAFVPPVALFAQHMWANGGEADDAVIAVFAILILAFVLLRVAGVARDVADSHSERRFRSLVQNSPDATVVLDADAFITYCTPSTARVLGHPLEFFIGRSMLDLLLPKDQTLLRFNLATPDADLNVEWQIRTESGAWRDIDVTLADLRGDPEVAGVALTLRDSSDRKRALKHEMALTEAREASQQKSTFLATMSHEIRTPLNGVIAMIDLLAESPLNAAQRDYAATMADSAESLAAIVNDVLDFSRIEAGKLEVERTEFVLRPAVEAALRSGEALALLKGIELLTVFEAGVPGVVIGDRLRLRQVLSNLVANATKFTDAGEVVITVSVEGAGLRFEVSDTGVGIAPADRERLFEQYVQLDSSTTRRHGGSGLGLAICKQLVALMDGEIGVASELGRGSTFWVTVPFAPVAANAVAGAPLDGVHVLVLARSLRGQAGLKSLLDGWSAETSCAADPDRALFVLQNAADSGAPVHVVLMDASFSDGDPLAFATALRNAPGGEHLRIIGLSMGPRDEEETADPAVDRWLAKPVRASVMFDCLTTMLTGPGEIEELAVTTAPDLGVSGHVLVVDDNAINRKVAVTLLEHLGYQADTADDGVDAVEKVGACHYDAVLMDCQMPRMDGYQATAAIRKMPEGGDVPIVAVTASAMSSDRDRCLAAGMDDFITKPVDRATMARIVRDCVASAQRLDAPVANALLRSAVADGTVTAGLLELDPSGALLRDLVQSFRETVESRSHELADAARARRFSTVAELAHEFKGASATLGLFTLAALYSEFESRATVEDPTVILLIDELAAETSIAIRGLDLLVPAAEKRVQLH